MQYTDMTLDRYDEIYAFWKSTPGMGLDDADSRENMDRFLQRNPGLCFLCVDEGKVVGTILCGHDGRRGYLYHVAVDPAYRNRGVGRTLVNMSLDSLRDLGIGKCHLFVYVTNELGQSFWRGTGWTQRQDVLIFTQAIFAK